MARAGNESKNNYFIFNELRASPRKK